MEHHINCGPKSLSSSIIRSLGILRAAHASSGLFELGSSLLRACSLPSRSFFRSVFDSEIHSPVKSSRPDPSHRLWIITVQTFCFVDAMTCPCMCMLGHDKTANTGPSFLMLRGGLAIPERPECAKSILVRRERVGREPLQYPPLPGARALSVSLRNDGLFGSYKHQCSSYSLS